MSGNALKALFYPFETEHISWPEKDSSVLYLNASYSPDLSKLDKNNLVLQQYNFAQVKKLENSGYSCNKPDRLPRFDYVLINIPKQDRAARAYIAHGLKHLNDTGYLVCTAPNNAGGNRLAKLVGEGAKNVERVSKHKCSIIIATNPNLGKNCSKLDQWIEGGSLQKTDTGYWSQAGIYGWNKIDKGSQIILEHIKTNLAGAGADFGCGYGFLSCSLLGSFPDIKKLYCIDVDQRAVEACKLNVKGLSHNADTEFLWDDVLDLEQSLPGLDWIIMNPPFHEGKNADIDLGAGFISAASRALKSRGLLWLVANAHLPYERVIDEAFNTHYKVFEGNGFKIYCAER